MDATQERMWTPDDVSAYLQVPVQTLYQWRRKGFGPQGSLRLREVTTPRVDDFLQAVRSTSGVATAKTCRTVVSGVMGLAVRYGAASVNPTREAGRLRASGQRSPRALTAEERARWLAAMEADRRASRRDLPDLTR